MFVTKHMTVQDIFVAKSKGNVRHWRTRIMWKDVVNVKSVPEARCWLDLANGGLM